jgi:hypothetical protein
MMPHFMRFVAWDGLGSNQHAVVEHISIQLLMLSGDDSAYLN